MVESVHRGCFVVVGAGNVLKMSMGHVTQVVYPRSSIKILQAFPTIASGAIEAFSLTHKEVAVLCASHSGEPQHVNTVQNMLQKAGFTWQDLACSVHRPLSREASDHLTRKGRLATPLHNNCSGKHVGMLMLAKLHRVPPQGYCHQDHPVQKMVARTLEKFTGCNLQRCPVGIDGCSVPTWAMPLNKIAEAFSKVARFSNGETIDDSFTKQEKNAIEQLTGAILKHPFMVAGTDRCCTRIMQVLGNKVVVKYGAEAVYTAAVPSRGLGIALKIDDGSTRAAESAIINILDKIGALDNDEKRQLAKFHKHPIKNCAGVTVGCIESVF